MKKKRSLFEELKQGIEEINQHLAGKITLKTYTLESKKMPEITPEIIRDTRERLTFLVRSLHMNYMFHPVQWKNGSRAYGTIKLGMSVNSIIFSPKREPYEYDSTGTKMERNQAKEVPCYHCFNSHRLFRDSLSK